MSIKYTFYCNECKNTYVINSIDKDCRICFSRDIELKACIDDNDNYEMRSYRKRSCCNCEHWKVKAWIEEIPFGTCKKQDKVQDRMNTCDLHSYLPHP